MAYEKFMYDLGKLRLTKADITGLEKEYNGVGEYLICSNETANEQVKAEILSILWTFSPNFLAGVTKFELKVFEALLPLSENANAPIQAIVKSTCGLDYLVDQAVALNGRGMYLACYDSNETEYHTKSGKTVYIYRCN